MALGPTTAITAIEKRLRFEALLADLSSRFVNLAPDEVDNKIEDAQRRVCNFLDLDLCALWQWSDDEPDELVMTHLFRSLEGPPIPEKMVARETFPWCLDQLLAGATISLSNVDESPPEASTDRETFRYFGVISALAFGLSAGRERIFGAVSFHSTQRETEWHDQTVGRLQMVAQVFANALNRKRSEEQLRRSFSEVEDLRQQLEIENAYLRREHQLRHGKGGIVGESRAIMKVLEMADQVASARTTVLIEGETGVGKELVAQRIHELSPRGGRPMVKVNCAVLPSNLVESELFGHEKGAYTGAVSRQEGRFEVANGSTIFLDEVAELPFELQAKLLRVLEEGRFERVGSPKTVQSDVRVIAATNRDLKAEVEAGRFRKDLFFRLAVFPILVPPLRARRGDVPLLVWSIVQQLSTEMNKSIESIRREDMERLQHYDWPGNVRELRNVVERALILCSGPVLRVAPPTDTVQDDDTVLPMDEMQRRHIAKVLEVTGGRIRGSGGAAEMLGMNPSTLRSRMKTLGLNPTHLREDNQSLEGSEP